MKRLLALPLLLLFVVGCGDLAHPTIGDMKDVMRDATARSEAHATDMKSQHEAMHPEAEDEIANAYASFMAESREISARTDAMEGRLNEAASEVLKTAASYAIKFLGLEQLAATNATAIAHDLELTNVEVSRLSEVVDGLDPATVEQLNALDTETKDAIKAAGNDRATVEALILSKVDEVAGKEIGALSDTKFWLLVAGVLGSGVLGGAGLRKGVQVAHGQAARDQPSPNGTGT